MPENNIPNPPSETPIPVPSIPETRSIFSRNPSTLTGLILALIATVMPFLVSSLTPDYGVLFSASWMMGTGLTGLLVGFFFIWLSARIFGQRNAALKAFVISGINSVASYLILSVLSPVLRGPVIYIIPPAVIFVACRYYFRTSIMKTVGIALFSVLIPIIIFGGMLFVIFGSFHGGW